MNFQVGSIQNIILIFLTTCVELKNIRGDGFLYIKEDSIVPHHMSIFDLIVKKAQGKTGKVLFPFTLSTDLELAVQETIAADVVSIN